MRELGCEPERGHAEGIIVGLGLSWSRAQDEVRNCLLYPIVQVESYVSRASQDILLDDDRS